jgi:nucleotide-binding universal stress UspA family protein
MYTNILIATDGSELAGHAVQHGIDLAMRIGAVTVLTPAERAATLARDRLAQTIAQQAATCRRHYCCLRTSA